MCVYIYIYMYMHIYIYIHTHTHTCIHAGRRAAVRVDAEEEAPGVHVVHHLLLTDEIVTPDPN